jgi:hypothetical protein
LSDILRDVTQTIGQLEGAETRIAASRPAEAAHLRMMQRKMPIIADFLRAEEAGQDTQPFLDALNELQPEAVRLRDAWQAESKTWETENESGR